MVILIPIVKLDNRNTFGVIDAVPVEFVAVRLQDLVSERTFEFNKTFHDIVSAGGLHDFLGFSGSIILSLIMKDEIIANFRLEKYAFGINSLMPDYYTTTDGETYDGEYSLSLKEIHRIHKENTKLVRICPNCSPIGLVKGCTENQIELHIKLLKSLGITDFAFHVGDFFRHGRIDMIHKARSFSHQIRRHTKFLILYGMGSQRRLVEFSFADAYVTFNHFVTAMNGMKFAGTKKVKYTGGYDPAIIISNFVEMYKNVSSLNKQTKLYIESEIYGRRNQRKTA